MNAACPQRVSLISALGLPTILSPTIGALTGVRPVARRFGSPPIARFAGFVFRSKTRPSTPTESSSRRLSSGTTCVTDWSFSFRCSPPRIAATQLRFNTARLFTAQKRTSTAPSHCPLRRTSAGFSRLKPEEQTSEVVGEAGVTGELGSVKPALAHTRQPYWLRSLRGVWRFTRERIKVFLSSMRHSKVSPFWMFRLSAKTTGRLR